ncbi:transposase [uncultured Sunxiuqinia sp.]|uniref:transposase n=1 Tax=uncultured Sunxiuqinia sp. TaxID=1573825 RepID=UPI00262011AE|nr:transposase [uncultured Sunxiuqinia sp.]
MKKALYGRITEHHTFILQLILSSIEHINHQIALIENQIDKHLIPMQEEVELLQTIPGVSAQIATGILAEIGNEMEHFPSHKSLASWADVCPGNNESTGKKYSSKITHGNKYLKTTLVEAALGASHSKDCLMAAKHKAIAARRGSKKVNIAIEHKILTASYFILRDKTPYIQNSQNKNIAEQRRLKKIERLEKQLRNLKSVSFN